MKRATNPTKTSQTYIPSYEKGGMVTKPKEKGIYTAEMGQPPQDIDGGSAPRKPAKPAKTAPKKK
jgi:hypothetical protein